jgi:ribonuclease T2
MPGPRFTLNKATINNILLCCLIAWALYSHFYPQVNNVPERQQTSAGRQAANDRRDEQSSSQTAPGKFDYYALVLSWSPSFCLTHGDNPQCSLTGNRRPYNFVLHGLWPQYQKGWPQDCPMDRPPFVPEPLIRDMLDIMPARGLIIHEYKKHGTCSGLTPDAYFDLARKLYSSIKIPARFQNPTDMQSVSPRDLIADFLRSNPELQPNMIAVSCQGGGDNELKEVHICISRDGQPTACGRNEVQRRLCDASAMTVPPVRARAAN